MIDNKRIKELVKIAVENDLAELDIRDKTNGITIRRGGVAAHHAPSVAMTQHAPVAPASSPSSPASPPAAPAAAKDDGLVAIESPMVGTFYTRPNPDSPIYVQVGKTVGPDTVVCLIEAMKVFNEIKAEKSGVIERILVENGKSVEFGQKLFLIRPS